jgi:putative ATPase
MTKAPDRRKRRHGIAVGYRLPHDYEGADVNQRYLPDLLHNRRYYDPSREGWEVRIRERMDALADARERGSATRRK